MIKSFTHGRIRFRAQTLKDPALMAQFKDTLKNFPGLRDIASSPVTGSVTLLFDPAVTTKKAAKAWIKDNLDAWVRAPALNESGNGTVSKTKGYYRVMALTFAICLVSPALGLMRLHYYSALAITGLAVKHGLDYRKKIV